eukprot:GHUV01041111.1.p1 GENE.GHUV01041111.1~~GHUV01041111.1.p1  ORF type:complete len:112 (+),score=18.47 GHUV01041111.1:181-516(+)
MGKKPPQQAKAAAHKSTAASSTKQPKQAKKRKDVSCDSLRDPLDRKLALVGLRVKQITADGNCFFRALSDQLEIAGASIFLHGLRHYRNTCAVPRQGDQHCDLPTTPAEVL